MEQLQISGMRSLSEKEMTQTDGGFLQVVFVAARIYAATPQGKITIAKVVTGASSGFGLGMLAKEIFG